MTKEQKRAALLHASWTCLALFVVAAVIFCCIPSQLWLVGILFAMMVGFLATRISYDIAFDERKIVMTSLKEIREEEAKKAEEEAKKAEEEAKKAEENK